MGSEESPASGLNLVRGELDVGGVEVGAGFKVRVDYCDICGSEST